MVAQGCENADARGQSSTAEPAAQGEKSPCPGCLRGPRAAVTPKLSARATIGGCQSEGARWSRRKDLDPFAHLDGSAKHTSLVLQPTFCFVPQPPEPRHPQRHHRSARRSSHQRNCRAAWRQARRTSHFRRCHPTRTTWSTSGAIPVVGLSALLQATKIKQEGMSSRFNCRAHGRRSARRPRGRVEPQP